MPEYAKGTTEDDYLRLKAGIKDLAAGGQFDANDALAYALKQGLTCNAGDIATLLGDMADLGELRCAGRTEVASQFPGEFTGA